jgi:hypothetical protein
MFFITRYIRNKGIIRDVKKWQTDTSFHPFTCGKNSNHQLLNPIIKNKEAILKCDDCNYEQDIPWHFYEIRNRIILCQRKEKKYEWKH